MKTYKIIAATGCPTGIAHTYMAQEALEEAAKKRGITIKVETHGQEGIKNALTDAEIEDADGVIIAADKDVHADRFIGKPVINVSVSKGIKEPDKLIDEILSGNVPKYKDGQARTQNQSGQGSQKTSLWHSLYVSLMNGVSHMLPLVVAGGVMVAISFMFGINSADPKSPEYNQFAYYLKTIGGVSMNLMVPILCAYIAESIAKRPGLIIGFIVGMIAYMNGTGFLGGIVGGFLTGYIMLGLAHVLKGLPKQLDGLKAIFLFPVLGIFIAGFAMWFLSSPMEAINKGMMSFLSGFQNSSPILLGLIVGCMSAFDMGGPVNKAAYVTGTALLAQGNYFFMAGVSAACIAPPLATGFAVLFGGKAYSASDRSAGYVNFLLGSTHITEGAIPFAAKKPIKVIPILMLGSSIAAILTYLFKVQVPAPHGGFIVLPIVTHAFLWVLAILIGSLVSGLLMAWDQKRTVAKDKQSDQVTQEVNESKSLDSVLEIRNIHCNVQAVSQHEVFEKLAEISVANHISSDSKAVVEGFMAREKLSTTGMEQGIAIPHTELDSIRKASIVILKLNEGVDWNALDGHPTNIVIAMFIPKGKGNDHLRYLSEVSKLLIHQEFIDQLHQANSSEEIYQMFTEKLQ
ncbi:PTS fructose transporter subunit IIABC [Heyndrickxia shackletonii]|uniref:PTS fructose transporter subunit IIABC n=1 Tax=Heyndrickxia shackletonii TaxID=157838 RepID=A0A0Q3WT35_9BACI|nr:fructose-specific PTS transporter subunit EIIC [Heyndrickxia shackletonii]KQL51467.1 PTS fructose transporter subunit IIABC [Heyndrickxia shackletonii]NEZ00817.1 PTS transporter subunit EIIA [Heyndrickxia shackletonii]